MADVEGLNHKVDDRAAVSVLRTTQRMLVPSSEMMAVNSFSSLCGRRRAR